MYVNTLITLQENLSTYGVGGNKLTGHVTITSPGMIKCYVQNLRNASSGSKYALYVFSKAKEKGVRIGELSSNKESKWMVSSKRVEGSEMNLDELDAVAIVAEDDSRGADTIMMGFKANRYMIIPLVEKVYNKRPKMKMATPKPEPTQAPMPTVKKQQVAEAKPETEMATEVAAEPLPQEKEAEIYKGKKDKGEKDGAPQVPTLIVPKDISEWEECQPCECGEGPGPVIPEGEGLGPAMPEGGLGPAMPQGGGPGPVIPEGEGLGPAMPEGGGPGPVIPQGGAQEPELPPKGGTGATIGTAPGPIMEPEDGLGPVIPNPSMPAYQDIMNEEEESEKPPCKEGHNRYDMMDEVKRILSSLGAGFGVKERQEKPEEETSGVEEAPSAESSESTIAVGAHSMQELEDQLEAHEVAADELKRIIGLLRSNQEVREKAQGIEAQIQKMSAVAHSHKLTSMKPDIEKTVEARYMDKQKEKGFDLDQLEEEDELEHSDSSPKSALKYIRDTCKDLDEGVETLSEEELLQIKLQEEVDFINEFEKKADEINKKRQDTPIL